jgi:hypothetical protein
MKCVGFEEPLPEVERVAVMTSRMRTLGQRLAHALFFRQGLRGRVKPMFPASTSRPLQPLRRPPPAVNSQLIGWPRKNAHPRRCAQLMDVRGFDRAADPYYCAESLRTPLNTFQQWRHTPPQIVVPIG